MKMKGVIPSLADKTALTLFYNNSSVIDFSPYNTFVSVIQKVYKSYIIKVRVSVYIQKIYKAFCWRKIIFDFKGTNGQYIYKLVEKLRPEWPIIAFTAFIDRRNSGMSPLVAHLDERHFFDGAVSWNEWVKFYDNWVTAFSHYLRPILARRRMNFHASLYNTRVLYRFTY